MDQPQSSIATQSPSHQEPLSRTLTPRLSLELAELVSRHPRLHRVEGFDADGRTLALFLRAGALEDQASS